MKTKIEDYTTAFTLRLQLYMKEHDPRLVIVKAFDDVGWDEAGRCKLDIEVRHGGKVIFPRGVLYCAGHFASDSIQAKELVLSTVAMKPGDTENDYFDGYSPEQLAWAKEHGESVAMVKLDRYCDESGECRS